MTRNPIPRVMTASAIALLAGCDPLWPDANWRSERYVLIEVDAREQMSLAFDMGDGHSMGLTDPTVFSIGADDKFIVLKQHPSGNGFGAIDRNITNYYIVERTLSPDIKERQKRVRGPMGREAFERLSTELSLPKFTKTFDDLK